MVPLTMDEEGDWRPAAPREVLYRYNVGYAPSGRARCRKCSDFIQKGKVRFGIPIKDPRGTYGFISCWQHLECTRLDDGEDVKPDKEVHGFRELLKEDQALVREELKKKGIPSHWESIDPETVVKREPGSLPRQPAPPAVVLPLLPFQEEGLAWMVRQEGTPLKGGVLADEMGMGKTIQAISLICANRPEALPEAPAAGARVNGRVASRTTFIVTPTSAMMQWRDEIKAHTQEGALKILCYYEKRKGITAEILSQYDVVLTTYPVVEAEWRVIINKYKVECEWCGKRFLQRRLVVHQRFFCGPDAERSDKLKKTEKKRHEAIKKGMRTLRITKEGQEEDSEWEEEEEARPVLKTRSTPTPAALYQELMQSAGRKAYSMYTNKATIMSHEEEAGPEEHSPPKRQKTSPAKRMKLEVPEPDVVSITSSRSTNGAASPKSSRSEASPTSSRGPDPAWLEGPDATLLTRIQTAALDTLSVPILKELCRRLGLPPTCKRKAELVERVLAEHQRRHPQGEAEAGLDPAGNEVAPASTTLEGGEDEEPGRGRQTRAATRAARQLTSPPTSNDTRTSGSDSDVVIVRRPRTAATLKAPPVKKPKVEPKPGPGLAKAPARRAVKQEPDVTPTKSGSKGRASPSGSTSTPKAVKPNSKGLPPTTPSPKPAAGKGRGRKRSREDSDEAPSSPLKEDDEDVEVLEDLSADGVDLSESPIHSVLWHRIILDEAHKIKGRTTSTAKSIYSLQSNIKWCLTGTPLQNRVGELYSLVRFLRMDKFAKYYCSNKECKCESFSYQFGPKQRRCEKCDHSPLMHFSYFNRHVINPIKRYGYIGDGRRAMLTLKHEVLDQILLRRTKAERAADVRLPPLTIKFIENELSPEERDFYESIYKRSRSQFDTYVDKGVLLHNYAHIFDLLSRLRQAVDHPYLVVHGNYEGKVLASESGEVQPVPVIPTRSAGCSDVCGICQDDVLPSVRVTSLCKHTFHRDCMVEYLETAPQLPEGGIGCPVCFVAVSVDLRPEAEGFDAPEPVKDMVKPVGRNNILQKVNLEQFASSTKVERLVELLQRIRTETPEAKSIIFSQYANMLHIVDWRLKRAGIKTVMLMGSLPISMRQAMLRAFREDDSVKVILISLKAGGEGLNLQVATNVFMLDPWWNPAVEMQAIQRAHRIGQTKAVTAYRFVTKDTIEERMMQLQEKKMLVFEGTVDGSASSMAKLTEEDLKFLFTN